MASDGKFWHKLRLYGIDMRWGVKEKKDSPAGFGHGRLDERGGIKP
jgi:hypothetical protein